MPAAVSKNNAYSKLAGALTAGSGSLTVTTGQGDRFPVVAGSDWAIVTLADVAGNVEIVKVTARASGADTMSITRAQEGTTARSWSIGDLVEIRPTVGTIVQADAQQTLTNKTIDADNNTLSNIPLTAIPDITTVGQAVAVAASEAAARTAMSAAKAGANTDITSLASLSTPLSVAQGGTGAATAPAALAALAPSSYTLGSIRVYTANDTWPKPANLRGVRVRIQAPGGGGAGALGASGQMGLGSGGGAGGYCEKWIAAASLGGTESVTIGAAGTAGTTAPSGGGNGGNTSFGTHCSASGGIGGSSLSAGTSATIGAAIGIGGSGSGGDLNCDGGPGAMAYRFSGTSGFGGNGGSSVLGGGGAGSLPGGGGSVGRSYGGGGGGGNSDSTTGRVGGAGGPGVVIVEEFF